MKRFFNIGCFILFSFLTLTGTKLSAQDIHASAKLDKSSISLGDQLTLSVSVHLPVKTNMNFPVLTDTLSSKVLIVRTGITDTIADKNKSGFRTITRRYVLTSFDTGQQMVPELSVQAGTEHFKTEALSFQVLAVKVDTTKAIFDIKQPIAVAYSWIDWIKDNWYWIAGPILLLFAAFAVFYYLRKNRREKPVEEVIVPTIPSHQLALEKLTALRNQKLWQQGQVKQYYSEVSDIIREYLEKRYQVKSLEQTSDEIFQAVRHLEITEQCRHMLKQVLSLADLVKFAKEQPLPGENETSMDNAIRFVEQTSAQDQGKGNTNQAGGVKDV